MPARLVLAFLCVLPLAGCLEERPPSDFDPAPPAVQRQPPDECPNLAGMTVDLAGDPLAAAILDRAPPDAHGLPMVLAFRRGATHQEAWWVVPREDLLAFARDLQQRAPERYARWRELVLRGKLSGSREWDFDGWLTAVSELGPPGPVYAGMVSYGCAKLWTRARDQGLRYAGGAASEREIWLARDRSGDLLVRDVIWNLKPFSIWGDAVNHIRTGSSSTWRRIKPFDPVSTEKLVEADLPPAAPSRRDARPNCAHTPERLVGFSQRILAGLPSGVSLAAFLPQPPADDAPRDCALLVIELVFEGPKPEALVPIDALLRADQDVRSLDLLPPPVGASLPRRRLRVVLR